MDKLITIFYNFFITILLTSFSFSASANRPAMEERSVNNVQQKVQQQQTQVEQASQQITQQPTQTGDVLVLPPKEIQAGETINIKRIDVPRPGVNMNAVRRQLGEPIATSASIGNPPITSWTYKDRIVYFEYSKVLHVVAR